jgi:hypothetical protein
MKQLNGSNKLKFRLKWIFMSSQAKYAYLWSKTQKLANLDYVRGVSINTDN